MTLRTRRRVLPGSDSPAQDRSLTLEKSSDGLERPMLTGETREAPTVQVSLWAALFLVIAFVALLIRAAAIIASPLDPDEIRVALAALDLTQGRVTGTGSVLPELIASLTIFLFGPSDVAARVGSLVLSGFGFVALALARSLFGTVATLVAAVLLALDPFAVAAGRRLDGEAAGALGMLLLLVALVRYQEERRPLWIGWAAGALCVLVLSGPRGVTGLLALVVAVAAARLLGERILPTDLTALDPRSNIVARWALIGIAGVVILLSSRLFQAPDRVGLVALTEWANELSAPAGLGPGTPLIALLTYSPLALIFGLVGAVRLAIRWPAESRHRGFVSLLASWSLVALVIAVLGGQRLVGPIGGAAVPLTLLAATAIADLILFLRREDLSRAGALLGATPLLVFAYITSAKLTQTDNVATAQWLAVALSLILIAGYVLMIFLVSGPAIGRVVGVTAAGLLFLVSWHATWWLNLRPSLAEWVLPEVASPALPLLVDDLVELSESRRGLARITVDPSLDVPFAWALRELAGVQSGSELDDSALVLLLPGAATPFAGAPGLAIRRVAISAAPIGPPQNAREFWRWFVWRTPIGTEQSNSIVVVSKTVN